MANKNQRIIRGAYADFYNDPPVAARAVRFIHSGAIITQQDFIEECDVNNVILRFAGTGELPPRTNRQEPTFGDVSETPSDLHQALLTVQAAEAAFDALPHEIRAMVNFDPQNLVDAYDYLEANRAAEPDVTKPDSKSENTLDKLP